MNEYTLNEIEQRLADDLDWAETAPEVQEQEGKLVVVRNKRVVAIGSDRDALLAQAAAQEQCPPEELVVVAVPRAGLWEIPH